jgi:spermidine synthase
MLENISHKKTLFLLFIEGFISVSLQIFIMRQIVPFTGNSVIIMSFVIGIFLASLAGGYMAGGRHKENHLMVLNKNLLLSAFWISIGFSYPVISYMFELLNGIFNNTFVETGIYLTIFLAPVVFLLGQTIPILTNFLKKNNVAELTGTALSINTVGSVLGSVLTSLVLFYYLGVSYTLMFDISLLLILSFIISGKNPAYKMINIGSSMIILVLAFVLNVQNENSMFKLTTNYTNYEVIEEKHNEVEMNILQMNRSYSSAIYKSSMSVTNFRYIDFIFGMLKDLNVKDKEILVLGAGGFTLSMRDTFNNKYTYVDIDPKIKEVVEKYFMKGKINGEFIPADARNFIKMSKKKYDLVIVDLFTNRVSIPWHVTTKEFMDALGNVMKKDSSVFFNIIQNNMFDDKYSQTVYNTITGSFDYCMVNPLSSPASSLANVIYFCRNKDEPKEIYIDEYSRVEFDAVEQNY